MCNCSYADITHSSVIKITNENEYKKYSGGSGSSDIVFSKDDYIGEWKSDSKKEYNFKLNKDMSFEMGWRNGVCKILEQENNIMLLKCFGDFGKKNKNEMYLRLQIFYYAKLKTEANLRLGIVFNQDLYCAKKGDSDSQECFHDGQDISFDMYYKE